jgi:hypothetical protein
MKKMKSLKYVLIKLSRLYVLTGLLSVLLVSCKEKEDEYAQDRMFRPITFIANMDANIASLSWTPIGGAKYILEVSKDSLLFETELQTIEVKNKSYRLEDLWSDTRYSVRIKSVSIQGDIPDSDYNEITFKTGIENIFYVVAPDGIDFNQVTLTWNKEKKVDRIVVSAAGLEDVSVTLSNNEISAGAAIITGLEPGTDYTFLIYLGEMLRGTVTAKTKAVAQP